LLIPAQLAYGSQGTSGIPPNSDLVFDVTVTKIGK
jgi:FKBP-type peptidyl-prolyl cis-trans isomerase